MIVIYMDWIAMGYLKHNIQQSDIRVIVMYINWIAVGYLDIDWVAED